MGLARSDDMSLTHWQASILSVMNGGQLYQMHITCGPKYPDEPPQVQFVHKVAIPGVDEKGVLNSSKFAWKRTNYIMDFLMQIEAQISRHAAACARVSGTY